MRPYDKDDFQYNGTIDVEVSTIAPQIKNKAGAIGDGWFKFGDAGTASMQLLSTDLSAPVTWTLQISSDRTVWATAVDENGTDVTGTVTANVGVVEPLHCVGNLYFRVYFTVASQTGTIAYKFKTGDNR
jgi:hypothetical protein